MSQNDFNLANQGFPSMRADMNSAFQALASSSSGGTAPATTYPYQWWYDTVNDTLKFRNADNDGWVDFATFDQATDEFSISPSAISGATVDNSIIGGTTPATGDFTTLTANNISDGTDAVATGYVVNGSAKAWVNFNGTGTVAIRDSFNVSSLTDNGIGQYSFTLANAMSDTSFAAQVTPQHGGYMGGFNQGTSTASIVKATAVTAAGSFSDSNVMACSTLGDLA